MQQVGRRRNTEESMYLSLTCMNIVCTFQGVSGFPITQVPDPLQILNKYLMNLNSVCAEAKQSLRTPRPAQPQHLTHLCAYSEHSTHVCERDEWLREVSFSLGDRLLYICKIYQSEKNEVSSLTPKEKT